MLSPAETIGTMPDGRPVQTWRLGRPDGVELTVMNYGARIASLKVPVRGGRREVLLTLDGLAAWLADSSHIGAIAGRFANRIAGARFTLDGREVRLAANNATNNLHGGPLGFGLLACGTGTPEGDALLLTLDSPDGDQNFPGAMHVELRYSVAGEVVTLAFTATAEAPTVVNLTSHAYFNLAGGGDVHAACGDAGRRPLPAGQSRPDPDRRAAAPSPARRSISASPWRWARASTPTTSSSGSAAATTIAMCLPMRRGRRRCSRPACTAGGVAWEVATTEPAVQFYTRQQPQGRAARPAQRLCLETQHFPTARTSRTSPRPCCARA